MYNGFVKLRRGLEEHLEAGKISYSEAGLYVRLMMKANYNTGVVYVSTKELATPGNPQEQVRKILDRLEEKQYIRTFRVKGSQCRYPILINKHCRGEDGSILNAFKSKSPEHLVWENDEDSSMTVPSRYEEGSISPSQTNENKEFTAPREVRSKEVKNTEKEEENMSFKSKIIDTARAKLRVRIPLTDKSWADVVAAARVDSQDVVIDAFSRFCDDNVGGTMTYPLSTFVRVMDGYIDGTFVQKTDNKGEDLAKQLLGIANDARAAFGKKDVSALNRLLESSSPEDVTSAFREYLDSIAGSDFYMENAAKNFVERAEQLLFLQKKRRDDAEKSRLNIERTIEAEKRKVAAENAAKDAEIAREKELEEDTLPAG